MTHALFFAFILGTLASLLGFVHLSALGEPAAHVLAVLSAGCAVFAGFIACDIK